MQSHIDIRAEDEYQERCCSGFHRELRQLTEVLQRYARFPQNAVHQHTARTEHQGVTLSAFSDPAAFTGPPGARFEHNCYLIQVI